VAAFPQLHMPALLAEDRGFGERLVRNFLGRKSARQTWMSDDHDSVAENPRVVDSIDGTRMQRLVR
jgi:hypothetical protein